MSTVGFGDFHPVNSFECMVCVFIFIFGNAIFAVIISNISVMFGQISDFYSDHQEEEEELSRFFGLIFRFNKRLNLN